MIIDTHTHSYFSYDSDANILDIARTAAERGFAYLALTDHVDFNFKGGFRMWRPEDFFLEVARAREIFPDFYAGVELGYTPMNSEENKTIAEDKRFVYVINSVHEVNGLDPYFPEYFLGKSKERAYTEYFEAVLASIDAPYYYSAIGHLGYVTRKAPYPDHKIHLSEYGNIIDEILRKVISREKILEVNTSAYRGYTMPDAEILARYFALGGRLVTIGSDAHIPDMLGHKYRETAELLAGLGFCELFVVAEGRRQRTFPLTV